MSRLRFKPSTSRIQEYKSIIATLKCLVVVPKIKVRSPPGNRTPAVQHAASHFITELPTSSLPTKTFTTAGRLLLKHQQTCNRDFLFL
jgi:hypothetical protein